jgi:hypothetical protein
MYGAVRAILRSSGTLNMPIPALGVIRDGTSTYHHVPQSIEVAFGASTFCAVLYHFVPASSAQYEDPSLVGDKHAGQCSCGSSEQNAVSSCEPLRKKNGPAFAKDSRHPRCIDAGACDLQNEIAWRVLSGMGNALTVNNVNTCVSKQSS